MPNRGDSSGADSSGQHRELAVYHHRADNLPRHGHHDAEIVSARSAAAYWRANLRLLAVLLGIWFAVSFLAGIVFVEPLNRIVLFGFPLGFWFAQQGSILTFVVLVFVYAGAMRRLERRHGLDDDP